MEDEQIKRILEDSYDDSKENGIMWMAREFYSRRLLSTTLLVWGCAIAFLVPAVYSAVRFFDADEPKWYIMYAAIFICCFYAIGLMKVFAWEMIHRNSIKREIKRLEFLIAELMESLPKKA
jgi:hypothetical protein